MPDSNRPHQVRMLTLGELERARRELRASLALARPDSPTRVPILAQLNAVEAELVRRAASFT
jgi:hypothetical protein